MEWLRTRNYAYAYTVNKQSLDLVTMLWFLLCGENEKKY